LFNKPASGSWSDVSQAAAGRHWLKKTQKVVEWLKDIRMVVANHIGNWIHLLFKMRRKFQSKCVFLQD
jgi:hypothetical protein